MRGVTGAPRPLAWVGPRSTKPADRFQLPWIAVGVVAVVAVSVFLAALSSGAEAWTRVKTVKPYTADGVLKSRYRAIHRSGECSSNSYSSVRRDAWRCFTPGRIREVCLKNPVEDEVACLEKPWSRRAVIVRTSLDPDYWSRARGWHPWAVKLARRRCIWANGATTVVRGRRLNYSCSGRPQRFLFGVPRRRRSTSTILMARSFQGAGMKRVRILTAWR